MFLYVCLCYLSGPLNRLNAILSLLHPLDRYRTPSAIGSAIGRPLSRPISHPNTRGSPRPPRSKPLWGAQLGDRQRGSAMEGVGENWTRFFKNPEKTRLKPGKNPEKTRLKPGKKSVGKCGEYAESWGSGDVVRDRGRTTHVPARGKTRKKTRFNFSPTPSSPTPFGRSRSTAR